MDRAARTLLYLFLAWGCVRPLAARAALDPPHNPSQSLDCSSCHITHHAPGGAITNVAGNSNLCMSCHTAGGLASSTPFADIDEAIPGTGGTSHRWDSGVSGWVKPNPANTSVGTVRSGGAFSGRYSKTYTLTIKSAGDAGTATFDWSTSQPTPRTYRDEFAAIAYSGSNGTQSWSPTPWLESGEADGVNAGSIRVVANASCVSGNCLRIGGGSIANRALRRPANLIGTNAMLTFAYRRQLATCPNTSTASVSAQISSDGTTWLTLATYNLNACDTVSVAQAFDITSSLAATTQVRFLGAGTAGGTDFIYIDNAQVEYLALATGGTSLPTGPNVLLDEGITATFANGGASPAFKLNDQWTIYATADVNSPANFALAARLIDGKVSCSTCHNQHNQTAEPFDPLAPPYPTPGVGGSAGPGGDGRHNQRLANDSNQMCNDCHSGRHVTAAALGSHPVGVVVPGGQYKNPATLPLAKTTAEVQCMTCHAVHYTSPVTDGSLLRMANTTGLCTDCHTLADTASPAAHLSPASGALWPGPQYGTTFPAMTDASQRGDCTNCHQAHGWPDAADPGQDFPRLLVNREENLCNACHDGSPVAANVLAQFSKSYRHPTSDFSGRHSAAESGNATAVGTTNRHAECEDCHDPHVARADVVAPVAPTASNRIRGVDRVAVTNGPAGTVPAYTYRVATDTTPPVAEYQVCFRCHSSWTTQPAGQSDMAVKFNGNNPSFHPVEGQGKNTNINPNAFINGWTGPSTMYCTDCHTSEDTTVRGPHGSQYRYLLKAPSIASGAQRTMASTEQCFGCHRFNTYANENGSPTEKAYSRFNLPQEEDGHTKHVMDKRAPCYACHDSHGSTTKPHNIVTGRNPGINNYTETATGGTCSPTCHGTESYRINYAR